MKLIAILLIFLGTCTAHAFPEMIRYGYVNCTACHVSPAGGGVLTPYGRGLSSEVLSTWGSEKEAQFLHGALPMEKVKDWLLVGGDYRGLQYHYENDKVKDGEWINMQGLIEAAVKFKNWTLNIAAGKFDQEGVWTPETTRYYVMDQINDYVSARVGRFIPQFGLNIPEHISPTREFLGFGAYDERDAAELQYADENWTTTASYSKAPSDHPDSDETAVSIRVEKVFADTFKPGFSAWRGENNQFSRQIYGLHGLFGFTKKLFLLSEVDWQEQHLKSSHTIQHSAVAYQKLGYELYKGVVGLCLADGELSTLEDPATQIYHYGLGVQFFPRPHFEIETAWTLEHAPQTTSVESNYAWILLHYYL